jgi:hypothetical protein
MGWFEPVGALDQSSLSERSIYRSSLSGALDPMSGRLQCDS